MPSTQTLDLFAWLPTKEYQNDPHPILRMIREAEPVRRSERSSSYYVTSHRECVTLFRSPKFGRDLRLWESPFNTFRNDRDHGDPVSAAINEQLQPWLLNLNPPNHTRIRAVFQAPFLPRAVRELDTTIAEATQKRCASLPSEGVVDMVQELARPLPAESICALFGVRKNGSELLPAWSESVMKSRSPVASQREKYEAKRDLKRLRDYTRELITEQRERGTSGFIGHVLEAEGREASLSEEEVVINVLGLLLAGHETTSALIGSGLYWLLRHTEQQQLLRARPDLMPTAVEELLRYEPASTLTPRVALADVELGGVQIAKGELCWGVHASANRDRLVFDDADRLDVRRSPNPHLTFGGGIHHCLGANLARLQAAHAFTKLLQRFEVLSLSEEQAAWQQSVSIRTLERLPVRVQEKA